MPRFTEKEISGDTVLMALIQNSWDLSMVHIGDGDELGQKAQVVMALMKANYPQLLKELEKGSF